MTENATEKQRGFQNGQSGNPAGKPKGVRNRATLMAEKLMQDDAEQVVRAVVEKAKQGDMTAARLIIERIAPVRKGRPITVDLPDAKTSADLAAAMASLVRARVTEFDHRTLPPASRRASVDEARVPCITCALVPSQGRASERRRRRRSLE